MEHLINKSTYTEQDGFTGWKLEVKMSLEDAKEHLLITAQSYADDHKDYQLNMLIKNKNYEECIYYLNEKYSVIIFLPGENENEHEIA